ncbi:MAG: hypothetical protein KDN20_10985 [Verrucomicrobiae bacterium]|nr:hypothetical protein [Verrucomicrobiae bacterium]
MKKLFLIVIGLFSLVMPAMALNPVVIKLHGRADTPQADNQFGAAVALTDKWMVIGEQLNDDLGTDAGAAHVYSATTGRYLRKLGGKEVMAGDQFGSSVAVCGDLAVVGAPFDDSGANNCGAIYVFDLRNGRQLLRVEPQSPTNNLRFGISVAMSHDRILVGAPQPNTGSGRAYLIDSTTGAELWDFTGNDVVGDERFGFSVAICGDLGLIGAPLGDSDSVTNCGSAYLFDLKEMNQIDEWHASDVAAGAGFGGAVSLGSGYAVVGAPRDSAEGVEAGAAYVFEVHRGTELHKLVSTEADDAFQFGNSVSVSGHQVLVGEYHSDFPQSPNAFLAIGSAYLFDLESGVLRRTFLARDFSAGDEFGTAVALCGDQAVIGSPLDDDLAANSGSAYFYRGISSTPPFVTLSKVGDFAPDVPDTEFRYFGQPIMQVGGGAFFEAGLKGPGSNGSRDKGIWKEQSGIENLTKSREDLSDLGPSWSGVTVNTVLGPLSWPGGTAANVSLKGVGVNGTNNRAILRFNYLLPVEVVARTGDDTIPVMAGAQISTILDAVGFGTDGVAIPCLLRNGVGGVGAGSNSGIYLTGFSQRHLREGQTYDGSELRQFFGRVAGKSVGSIALFGAYHVPSGETTSRQGVFGVLANPVPSLDVLMLSQKDSEPIDPELTFRSFLGENQGSTLENVIRATLVGPGVAAGNNEGLWQNSSSMTSRLLREGDEVDPVNLPGVRYSRILKFWTVGFRVIAQVTLRGSGVRSTNDTALIQLSNMGFSWETTVLMREGDVVCDGDCPRVRAIQRVEVNRDSGLYAVVASLTGSPAKNQGLFVGSIFPGEEALTRPVLKLRKGTLFQVKGGQTTRLRSIDFRPIIDRTGSGANGGSQVMAYDGVTVFCLSFDNRVKELITLDLMPGY